MSAIGEFVDYVTTAGNWTGSKGLLRLTANQLLVSGIAVTVAAAVAVPAGLGFGHVRRGGLAAVSVANIGRALPSFAVLVLAFGVFSQAGRGLSIWPTAVALTLLAIPPMFTNTYTGVKGVDPQTRDAAAGMGMRRRQQLWKVEAPIALPLVMTGIRVSATQVVATATLGAWVGFQCLGTLIFEGFAQQNDGKILTGAVMVSMLTIAIEVAFSRLERRLSPWTVVPSDGPVDEPPAPTLLTAVAAPQATGGRPTP